MCTQYKSFKIVHPLGSLSLSKPTPKTEKMHKYSEDVAIINVQHRKSA